MDYMKEVEDNFFDLAIVDPPYGIGKTWLKSSRSRYRNHVSTYDNSSAPTPEYFEELFRVSKNQIIWGGNYFRLPLMGSWIVWDKQRNSKNQFGHEAELAWTSLGGYLRIVKLRWCGCVNCEKRSNIHPHEKPVKLYKWLLKNYAKQGDKILDTHLGSGSIAIACDEMGFGLWGCEIDSGYFRAAKKRLKQFQYQMRLNI